MFDSVAFYYARRSHVTSGERVGLRERDDAVDAESPLGENFHSWPYPRLLGLTRIRLIMWTIDGQFDGDDQKDLPPVASTNQQLSLLFESKLMSIDRVEAAQNGVSIRLRSSGYASPC